MRFDGHWFLAPDGVLRPIVKAHLLAADGAARSIPFMVDSGADRTVFAADALEEIGMEWPEKPNFHLEGIGGRVRVVDVDLTIYLFRETGDLIPFRGPFLGFTDLNDLEISVFGRDLLNNFAVILDRKQELLTLLAPHHSYSIQEP